ncbi:MAG: replication-associated recombination protein A [Endomicrobium sp.]|jgi:putative ATPase|nr:replication-associated recombination protein A [Endomicrobium sp.]
MEQKDLFLRVMDKQNKPLAIRMSPRNFEEFVGQDDIVGDGKLLRRLIEHDNLCSSIFFGPPGTGKSALAKIIASKTKAYFKHVNSVTIRVMDIKRMMEDAKSKIEISGRKTILILDEFHHFNRSQQDVLLPYIERGIITLVGITTENPLFYINAAIISRSIIFEFKSLPEKALLYILDSALKDKENGFGNFKIKISGEVKEYLIFNACGDARKLLNALEIGVLSIINDNEDLKVFDLNVAQESVQKRTILYSRSGDTRYDYISAFIKAMRGTDPDATIYWMAKMLEAGEDPYFIIRRIIICASEDVGIADPRALIIAVSALNAIKFIGMPEARIVLAEAAIYVASAPKSNASYVAIEHALSEVRNGKIRNVPSCLKNLSLDGKEIKRGYEYKYPHDYEGHYVRQDYWPDPVELYTPTQEGYEGKVYERLLRIRKNKDKA